MREWRERGGRGEEGEGGRGREREGEGGRERERGRGNTFCCRSSLRASSRGAASVGGRCGRGRWNPVPCRRSYSLRESDSPEYLLQRVSERHRERRRGIGRRGKSRSIDIPWHFWVSLSSWASAPSTKLVCEKRGASEEGREYLVRSCEWYHQRISPRPRAQPLWWWQWRAPGLWNLTKAQGASQ